MDGTFLQKMREFSENVTGTEGSCFDPAQNFLQLMQDSAVQLEDPVTQQVCANVAGALYQCLCNDMRLQEAADFVTNVAGFNHDVYVLVRSGDMTKEMKDNLPTVLYAKKDLQALDL